jgi:hypothetical protein
VDVVKVKLLVERLTRQGDGREWFAGAFVRGGDGNLATVHIDGLGPRGMDAARGAPGKEAIIATLERLERDVPEEQRGAVQWVLALFRDLPSETFAAISIEVAKRWAGL